MKTPAWKPKRYCRDLQAFKLISTGSGTWVKYADAKAHIAVLEAEIKRLRQQLKGTS